MSSQRAFAAGFSVATVLWGGAAVGAWALGLFDPPAVAVPQGGSELVLADDAGPEASGRARARRGRRRGGAGRDDESTVAGETPVPRALRREATTGDSLDEDRPREIDVSGSGGEQQLSSAQIEAAFGRAFPRIRRCLVLAAGDEPVTGRVVFGLRIRGTGEVAAVRLSGPAAVTTGEAGSCLRSAARAIRFPSFDGPEMVARYPLTLE